MECENGYLYLNKKEVESLSSLFMNDFRARYEVDEFIMGMKDVQDSLIEERDRYLSMSDRGAREDAAIALLETAHEFCGKYIELGKRTAERAVMSKVDDVDLPRLDGEDIFDYLNRYGERLKSIDYGPNGNLARDLLVAIAVGDRNETERIGNLLDRMNAAQMKIIK